MQTRPTVGQVQRHPPTPRLGVDGPAGPHERSDVGDGVAKDQIRTRRLERERLVEVGASDGVQRDEVDVGAIDAVRAVEPGPGRGDLVGLGDDRRREPVGNVEASTQFPEASSQAPVVVDEADHAVSDGRP